MQLSRLPKRQGRSSDSEFFTVTKGVTVALKEVNEKGETWDVLGLPHEAEFNRVWNSIPVMDRDAIVAEINRRLNLLVTSPDPNWGSITNTSIEGGKVSPATGKRGDWAGTPFDAIYVACGFNEDVAAMFYGNVWKWVIIRRQEHWIGLRSNPTFPQRGISLQGKTYFLAR